MRKFPWLFQLLLVAMSGSATAQHLLPDELAAVPVPPATLVEAYGTDPLQFGELRLPAGAGPFPVVAIIHGGCWTKGFATLRYLSPLAAALAEKGVASWNIEYRQLGDPGAGWPGTFLDWAAGLDHLREISQRYPLDLSRLVVIGHSAGAHGALWVAGRQQLSGTSEIRGAGDPLRVRAAIGIDGPGDIAGNSFLSREVAICGQTVVENLMGGPPSAVPGRYAQGNPRALLPVQGSQVLVASAVLLPEEAADYAAQATSRGGQVSVVVLSDAGHFDMLSPTTPSGAELMNLILGTLGPPQTE